MQRASGWGRLVKAKAFTWGHGQSYMTRLLPLQGAPLLSIFPPGCRSALPWAMCSLPFQGVRPQRQVFPSLRNLSYFYMFFFLFSFWHDNAYSLTMIFSILVFCISVFVVFPIEDDEASGRGWWCESRFYLRASSQGKGVLAPSSGDNHHHHNHFTLTLFVLFVLSVVK